MRAFILLTTLFVSTCSASLYGAISTQYQHLDPHGHTYAYGYSDPNSQKHESRSHDGVTRGSYSYVDGHGHKQSISYTADPHHGFQAVGTNLPKAPSEHVHYAAAHAYVPHQHHYAGHGDYHGDYHHVALTHTGVPVDTPEVQHAKAAHLAAHAAAAAAAHDHYDDHYHHLHKRSLYGGPWAFGGAGGHHHAVALTHDGVPIDEPAVQAAKAEHFAAHAKALGHVAHAHGAPVETPEVQHAKAAHFAAHAAARSGHAGHLAGGWDAGYHGGYAVAPAHGYHVPVIHNGVPVETPEVQHAKAAHFAAVAEASSRAGHGHDWDDGHSGAYAGDYHHGGGAGAHAHGPIHIPVIHNGVPVEPPEVQHARAAHLSALAAANHGAGHGGYSGDYHGSYHHDDGQYHAHYDHHY